MILKSAYLVRHINNQRVLRPEIGKNPTKWTMILVAHIRHLYNNARFSQSVIENGP